MRILLISIRPVYCDSIYNKSKKYEFRRRAPSVETGSIALIYETSPRQKITGCMVLSETIYASPPELSRLAGDSDPHKNLYLDYLAGGTKPGALPIEKVTRWTKPIKLANFFDRQLRPPQSAQFITLRPLHVQRLCDQSGWTF